MNAAAVELTPVQQQGAALFKRDDLACFIGPNFSSGSKVRQYLQMAAACPGAPMVVGCSATSAQQIYVADCARRTGVRGIVFVPKRATRTVATEWAIGAGAQVVEISPGYPSVLRARARVAAKDLGGCVRWNPALAVKDTIAQCANVPTSTSCVVVPIGSGLVAAGVLAGLAGRAVDVIGVAVSDLAHADAIVAKAAKETTTPLPNFRLVRHPKKYDQPMHACLPDGSRLDPWYAAKALEFVPEGGLLWITGRRPDDAMGKGE